MQICAKRFYATNVAKSERFVIFKAKTNVCSHLGIEIILEFQFNYCQIFRGQ